MKNYPNIILFGNSGSGKSHIADYLVNEFGYNKFHFAFYVRKFLYKKLLNMDLEPNYYINKKHEEIVIYNNKTIQELLIDSVDLIHYKDENITRLYNSLNLLTIYLNDYTVFPGLRPKENYYLLNTITSFNFINILVENNNNQKKPEKYDRLDLLNTIKYLKIDNTNLLNNQELYEIFNNIFKKEEFSNKKQNTLVEIISYLPFDTNYEQTLHEIKDSLELKLNEFLDKKLLKN